eukprot:CAMPEP_0181512058 /NCGR_PEP_ID=MMETSP1110-20121109/61768_1 /TAXON_ID=174948 /ORGANISM="Symbiodinium sp., Strain CCMP421" /LENGTH=155 /DNA_ID=CAMNT_0023641843 /DNA_START=312 /DNA_END=778 /DNA_ORIENTATION=-
MPQLFRGHAAQVGVGSSSPPPRIADLRSAAAARRLPVLCLRQVNANRSAPHRQWHNGHRDGFYQLLVEMRVRQLVAQFLELLLGDAALEVQPLQLFEELWFGDHLLKPVPPSLGLAKEDGHCLQDVFDHRRRFRRFLHILQAFASDGTCAPLDGV